MTRKISSQYYAIFFLFYAIILCFLNNLIFGEFIPSGTKGLWILASFAPLLITELLVRTIASAPYDSAANSVVALATLLSLSGNEQITTHTDNILRVLSFVLLVLFALSLSVIWLERIRRRESLKNSISVFTSQLGNAKAIFTVIHFFVLYALQIGADEVFYLAAIWVVIVFGRPLEWIVDSSRRIYEMNKGLRRQSNVIGDIVSRSHPGLLTIRVEKDEHPEVNSLVIVHTSSSFSEAGVVLDNCRLSDELWSKVLVLRNKVPNNFVSEIKGPKNVALSCSDVVAMRLFGDDYSKDMLRVVGSVIERSNINQIQIELYRDHLAIEEGQILNVQVGNQSVMYQVTNGITVSEELLKADRHGYMQIRAKKVGFWDSDARTFEQVSWTPSIYSPVYLTPTTENKFDKDFIGFLPGTELGLTANCRELVTHNTAILGVLGSGKTTLAIELILRMAKKGIKVFIIDITGEYERVLNNQTHVAGLEAAKKHEESEGFSFANEARIKSEVQGFLECDEQFVKTAHIREFGELSPVKVTQLISEAALAVLRKELSDDARLCLVLEEAHSLVPEWNSTVERSEQYQTNGTAKAIMQGRKHGFGCLLVTQRTANVTKSILNQCNTMFALQIFDDTGKEFLQNYFGEEYASMLPSLPEFHCVAFGRGLNAKTPILIKLNDSEDFRNSLVFKGSSEMSCNS